MRFVPGPDLPTGGHIVGPGRRPRGVRDRPRHLPHPGDREDRAAQRPQDRHRRHRAAVRRRPGEGHHPDQGPGPGQEDHRHLRPQGPDRPQPRPAPGHRGQRNGFNPEAVLAELYRLTPMEETFGINNVALVDGQPRTLGLKELLSDLHRPPPRRHPAAQRVPAPQAPGPAAPGRRHPRRAAQHRRGHPGHQDRATTPPRPRAACSQIFDLSEIQAQYILDTPLRRLTRFDQLELEREQETLRREIAELTDILDNDGPAPRPGQRRDGRRWRRSSAPRAARC